MCKQSFDTLLFTLPIIMYVACDLLAVGYLNYVFLMQATATKKRVVIMDTSDGFAAFVGVIATPLNCLPGCHGLLK